MILIILQFVDTMKYNKDKVNKKKNNKMISKYEKFYTKNGIKKKWNILI
jgi:hypothetical protein